MFDPSLELVLLIAIAFIGSFGMGTLMHALKLLPKTDEFDSGINDIKKWWFPIVIPGFAIVEEIMFRWALNFALDIVSFNGSRLVVAGTLDGAAHCLNLKRISRRTIGYFSTHFVAGVVFQAVYQTYGLLGSWAAHTFVNLSIVTLSKIVTLRLERTQSTRV